MASQQAAITPAKILISIIIYAILSLIIALNIISTQSAFHQLLDFGSFVAAGRAATKGDDPYTIASPFVYLIESQNTHRTIASVNLNPPISVILFRGIANTDPVRAAFCWRIVSAIFFLIGLIAVGWWYRAFLTPLRMTWALSLAGFWHTISLGQIYAPIFLFAIGTWILLENKQTIAAGILLGAMIAIKPNFVFWLALLVLAGYTQTFLSAATTTLVLSILPIFIFGTKIYQQWIVGMLSYPSLGLMIAGNSSLQSLAARFGAEHLGLFLSLALASFAIYLIYRNKSSFRLKEVNSLGMIIAILISPFSWPGYGIMTLPIFFSMKQWNLPLILAAACLAFPYALILYLFQNSMFHSIFFGWLYGWGLLLLLISIMADRYKDRAENVHGDPIG